MRKSLPPHFNYGVVLENFTYYASQEYDDFSVVATGEITDPFWREVLQRSTPRLISRYAVIKPEEQEIKQYMDVVSKPTSFLFTLDKKQVKALKKMSRLISIQDKERVSYGSTNASKLVFEPRPNNTLLIWCEIIEENSEPYLGGFESFEMTLKNVTFDKRFEIQCDKMRCLPDCELEVRHSEQGLITFYSNKKNNAVHFVTH